MFGRLHSEAEPNNLICDAHTTIHPVSKLLLCSKLVEARLLDHLLKQINNATRSDRLLPKILLHLEVHLQAPKTLMS